MRSVTDKNVIMQRWPVLQTKNYIDEKFCLISLSFKVSPHSDVTAAFGVKASPVRLLQNSSYVIIKRLEDT